MFGGKKSDLASKEYQVMKLFDQTHDDLPEGAFFALAEDMHSWDSEDWGWFSEVQKFDKDYN